MRNPLPQALRANQTSYKRRGPVFGNSGLYRQGRTRAATTLGISLALVLAATSSIGAQSPNESNGLLDISGSVGTLAPGGTAVGAESAVLAQPAPPFDVCIGQSASMRFEETIPPQPPSVDIVFAFDTTSSMDDTVEQMKLEATTILNTIGGRFDDARFGLASFRDYAFSPYGARYRLAMAGRARPDVR